MKVVLASSSPSRLEVLMAAGLRPDVVVSGVDESAYDDTETPEQLVITLATAKARTVATQLDKAGAAALVIGCDSMLVFDGETLGKPGTAERAIARLQRQRGRSGILVTGHCLIEVASRRELTAAASTTVHFADLSDREIAAYVATGEPLQVAGAFTIEGYGGAFVTAIEGDHSNVLGISLPLLRTMTAELGIAWTDLWVPRFSGCRADAAVRSDA